MSADLLANNWPSITISFLVIVVGLIGYGELGFQNRSLKKDLEHLKGNFKQSQMLGQEREAKFSELKGWVKARLGNGMDDAK